MKITEEFFAPIKEDRQEPKRDADFMKTYILALEKAMPMLNMSFVIIDYKQKNFLHVSHHPLFLSGYTCREVMEAGYAFYPKVVPGEDLNMLLELNRVGFEFFYKLSLQERTQGFIAYDFRLRHKNGNTVLIHHKLRPLVLDETGNIWFSLGVISLSTASHLGNAYIMLPEKREKYIYDKMTKSFRLLQHEKLSKRELEVLQIMALGYNSNEMAEKLFVSVDTIKFHRRNILKKLHVSSSAEAVYLAQLNGILDGGGDNQAVTKAEVIESWLNVPSC